MKKNTLYQYQLSTAKKQDGCCTVGYKGTDWIGWDGTGFGIQHFTVLIIPKMDCHLIHEKNYKIITSISVPLVFFVVVNI